MNIFEASITILLSGLFDKSFFITAFMAMKFSKWIVMFSAIASLSLIGIISVYLGIAINLYISAQTIHMIAIALFIIFGIHVIYDGIVMKYENTTEVEIIGIKTEEENNMINILSKDKEKYSIAINEKFKDNLTPKISFEDDNSEKENMPTLKQIKKIDYKENNHKKLNVIKNEEKVISETDTKINKEEYSKSYWDYLFNDTIKAISKVFFLILFSEIGDRSQISTIYLSTNFNKFSVIISVIISSFILTILAVFGCRLLANKISEKILTIFAGSVFILFAIVALCYTTQVENNTENLKIKNQNSNNVLNNLRNIPILSNKLN